MTIKNLSKLYQINEENNQNFERDWLAQLDQYPEQSISTTHTLTQANQKILLCSPHQDDEVLGSFFFLQKEAIRQKIDLLYLTKGNQCKTAHLYADITSIRIAESNKALEGISIANRYQWDFEDKGLQASKDKLSEQLASLLQKGQYDLVLSTAPNDRTPDHALLGEVLLEMLRTSPTQLFFYRSTWETFGPQDADWCYTGQLAQKQAALNAFVSQSHIPLLSTLLYSAIESHAAGGAFAPVELFMDARQWSEKILKEPDSQLIHWQQAKKTPYNTGSNIDQKN